MGALTTWKVNVWTAIGGTSYHVPNVQSVSFTYGRTQPTDDFPAAQATLTGILPDSLPALFKSINSIVSCDLYDATGTTLYASYWFTVKSLTRTYGTIANLDTWQMTGVGWINQLTEQQFTADYAISAGTYTVYQAQNICNYWSIANTYTDNGNSLVSAQTYPANSYINDAIQELMRTEQGRIIDCVVTSVRFVSRNFAVNGAVSTHFSDDVSDPLTNVYTAIDFLNSGDYLANTVIVQPEGLSAVSVGTTRPVLSFQTVDQTTTQATDLASYIKSTLDLNTVRPLSLTYLLDDYCPAGLVIPMSPGTVVAVTLRGTYYECVVEGVSVTASPAVTTVTLNLSSAEAYQFLRLDDAIFGTLDENRLGF